MNRSTLISAVQQCCTLCGYNSRTLGIQNLTAQAPQFPAALICEPTFQSIEGRNHGKIVYGLQIYLLDAGIHLSPEQRSQLIANIESNLLEILSQLSEHEKIACIDELTIEPIARAVVGLGEVGVVAKCMVTTIF